MMSMPIMVLKGQRSRLKSPKGCFFLIGSVKKCFSLGFDETLSEVIDNDARVIKAILSLDSSRLVSVSLIKLHVFFWDSETYS